MIVLDASVLIAHLDRGSVHHDRAKMLLEDSIGHELAASPVTLAEVLAGPARAGMLGEATTALHILGVGAVQLMDDAPVRLAKLRADTRLKTPDCCVLLAAEQLFASLATFDKQLASAAREQRVTVLPD